MIYFVILAVTIYAASHIKAEQQEEKRGILAAVIAFICLICGLRDMLGGYDNYIYGEIFDLTALDLRRGIPFPLVAAFRWQHSEVLYAVWTTMVAHVTTNRYFFFLITAVTFYALLFRHLTKYSQYPFIALFIILCLFYFFTFTYLRQILAVAIAWFAIPYAVDRKPFFFFPIVVLATLIHSSAVMFGLVYFFANMQLTKNQYVYTFIATFIIGLTPIGTFLVSFFGENINEAKAAETIKYSGSARIDYVLEAGFFLWFYLRNYKKVGDGHYSICMQNIAFLFMLTLLMFVRFENGGRLTWVFMIGIACWVAECIANTERNDISKTVMYIVMTLLYLRIVFAWGNMLTPYKTFLTDGVRAYDIIWQKNEYDHRYDNDKLYKW